jgi:hypothetical protein
MEKEKVKSRYNILEGDRREKKYLAIYSLIRNLISTSSFFCLQ